jgi:hypothetical protein
VLRVGLICVSKKNLVSIWVIERGVEWKFGFSEECGSKCIW